MAQSPDGQGVLLFGGASPYSSGIVYENRILELRAGANTWNILDITLETEFNDGFVGRCCHVVIPSQ